MLYNLNFLSSMERCDQLLTKENTNKNKLEMKRIQRESQITSGVGTAEQIPLLIASLDAEIAGKQAELAAATDPQDVMEIQFDLHNLQADRLRQVMRGQSFEEGDQALDHYTVGKLEYAIIASSEYIAALETRKAAIITAQIPPV